MRAYGNNSFDIVLRELGLQKESNLKYRSNDFLIEIFDEGVYVLDKCTMERLDEYDWQILYEVVESGDHVDFNDEGYMTLLLMKIISHSHQFLKRKEELEYFNICRKRNFFKLDFETIKSFQVKKCEVFKFHSIDWYEISRPGKDNFYKAIEITDWYIKYYKAIIENTYLKSLLPAREEKRHDDYLPSCSCYSMTGVVASFELDIQSTQELHEKFNAELFFEH